MRSPQQRDHLAQILNHMIAEGGVFRAIRQQIGHHANLHAPRPARLNAVQGILQYQAFCRRHPKLLCRQQENFRIRLGMGHLIAGNKDGKIVQQPCVAQAQFHPRLPAGRGHGPGDAGLLQMRQQRPRSLLGGNIPLQRPLFQRRVKRPAKRRRIKVRTMLLI